MSFANYSLGNVPVSWEYSFVSHLTCIRYYFRPCIRYYFGPGIRYYFGPCICLPFCSVMVYVAFEFKIEDLLTNWIPKSKVQVNDGTISKFYRWFISSTSFVIQFIVQYNSWSTFMKALTNYCLNFAISWKKFQYNLLFQFHNSLSLMIKHNCYH